MTHFALTTSQLWGYLQDSCKCAYSSGPRQLKRKPPMEIVNHEDHQKNKNYLQCKTIFIKNKIHFFGWWWGFRSLQVGLHHWHPAIKFISDLVVIRGVNKVNKALLAPDILAGWFIYLDPWLSFNWWVNRKSPSWAIHILRSLSCHPLSYPASTRESLLLTKPLSLTSYYCKSAKYILLHALITLAIGTFYLKTLYASERAIFL